MSGVEATNTASSERRLNEVLDDLCARFLVNLPASEYTSFERLFFAIEAAHWFYEDFFREHEPLLPRLPLKTFAGKLFEHTPLLKPYSADVDKLTQAFKNYKQEVPTCGAAMLTEELDKVLLVRGWGAHAKWGFPKGKVANGESEMQAAIREVLEETGFDLGSYINENTYFIDSMTGGRLNRIFVVGGIPESTKFVTKTRKEISKIAWVNVNTLPDAPRKKSGVDVPAHKNFFFVTPYVGRLRAWIKRQKRCDAKPANGSSTSGVNNETIPPDPANINSREGAKRTNIKLEASGGLSSASARGAKGRKSIPLVHGSRGKKERRRGDDSRAQSGRWKIVGVKGGGGQGKARAGDTGHEEDTHQLEKVGTISTGSSDQSTSAAVGFRFDRAAILACLV